MKLTGINSIYELYLGRHGNAKKQKKNQPDSARQLSKRGERQAFRLQDCLNMGYHLVLTSPLARARITTLVATNSVPMNVPELGISPNPKDPLNIMFGDLRYSPLEKPGYRRGGRRKPGYYQHRLGRHVKIWAQKAADKIISLAEREAAKNNRPATLFAGGHAVALNALADELASRLPRQNSKHVRAIKKLVRRTNLGEAEVICLDLSHDGEPSCRIISPR